MPKQNVQIRGSIEYALKGLEKANVSRETLVGMPINDENRHQIGMIDRIDGDTWYGHITMEIVLDRVSKLSLN
jgi:hypothetical protein